MTVKLKKKLKKGKHRIKLVLSASATSKDATIIRTVRSSEVHEYERIY